MDRYVMVRLMYFRSEQGKVSTPAAFYLMNFAGGEVAKDKSPLSYPSEHP